MENKIISDEYWLANGVVINSKFLDNQVGNILLNYGEDDECETRIKDILNKIVKNAYDAGYDEGWDDGQLNLAMRHDL